MIYDLSDFTLTQQDISFVWHFPLKIVSVPWAEITSSSWFKGTTVVRFARRQGREFTFDFSSASEAEKFYRQIEARSGTAGNVEEVAHRAPVKGFIELTDADGKLRLCRTDAIAYCLPTRSDKTLVLFLGHGDVYFTAEESYPEVKRLIREASA